MEENKKLVKKSVGCNQENLKGINKLKSGVLNLGKRQYCYKKINL
jgi:hypothetical protein